MNLNVGISMGEDEDAPLEQDPVSDQDERGLSEQESQEEEKKVEEA